MRLFKVLSNWRAVLALVKAVVDAAADKKLTEEELRNVLNSHAIPLAITFGIVKKDA